MRLINGIRRGRNVTSSISKFEDIPVWHWNVIKTPLGPALAAGRSGVLTHLSIGSYASVEHLKLSIASFIPKGKAFLLSRSGDSGLFAETEIQLCQYCTGTRREFSVPFSFQGTPFQNTVWNALCEIPFGETATYGEIAEKVGNPKGARAVGGAVHRNPIAVIVPCHRVVAGNGLGGFAAGLELKKKLLEIES